MKEKNHIPLPNHNIPNLKLQITNLTNNSIKYKKLTFLNKNQITP